MDEIKPVARYEPRYGQTFSVSAVGSFVEWKAYAALQAKIAELERQRDTAKEAYRIRVERCSKDCVYPEDGIAERDAKIAALAAMIERLAKERDLWTKTLGPYNRSEALIAEARAMIKESEP